MSALPRAPLTIGKSGSPDSPDNYSRKMLEWREAAKAEAQAELKSWVEYGEVSRYIDAIEGRYYREDHPKYRSRFVDNEMAKSRKDARTMYTDIRPAMAVKSNVPEKYDQQAHIIMQAISSEWVHRNMNMTLLSVIDHALFGCGFWKIGAMTPGVLTVTDAGSDSVLPIKCTGDIQQSAAVLYRTWRPIQDLIKRWGSLADGLERQAVNRPALGDSTFGRPGMMGGYSWKSLSPAMRRLLRNRIPTQPVPDVVPFPEVEVEEYWVDDVTSNEHGEKVLVKDPRFSTEQHNYWYWVDPKQQLFPRKRLIVFAGEKQLYDGPSPYWHGLYPFEMLLLDPIVWGSRGLSKYRNLISLNNQINKIGAGVSDTIEKAINQTVISKRGAILDEDWQRFFPDIAGQKLRMNMTANPSTDVKFMDPPNLPGYVLAYLQQYLLPQFDKHSGSLDMRSLAAKKQIPAGDSIDMMQQSQGAHYRLEGRLIEAFLASSARQCISNVLQYFTLSTRRSMLGADGVTWEDFTYPHPSIMIPAEARPDAFWKTFTVELAPGSLHGGARDREKQMAVVLFKSGAIGIRELLRRLEWPDADRVYKELLEERESMPQVARGRVPRMTTAQQKGKVV